MTDRIQQMLDTVKEEFGVTTAEPKGWRAKGFLRARARAKQERDTRDGILKNPHQPQGKAPKPGSETVLQASYFGPNHPDEWRSPDLQARSEPVHPGAPKIDPAAAAIAAFQSNLLKPMRHSQRTFDAGNVAPSNRDGDLADGDREEKRRWRRSKRTAKNVKSASPLEQFLDESDYRPVRGVDEKKTKRRLWRRSRRRS